MDTEHDDIKQRIRVNDLWLELAMDEEETQKSGMIFIIDLGGIPMRLMRWMLNKHVIKSSMKEEVRNQGYLKQVGVQLFHESDNVQ